MSVQEGIDAIGDIQKFYRTHYVAACTNIENEEKGSRHCIWGAAILTGHANPHGQYGKKMQPEMKRALEKAVITNEVLGAHKGLGGYNDNTIFGFRDNEARYAMRAWLKRAKALLKAELV